MSTQVIQVDSKKDVQVKAKIKKHIVYLRDHSGSMKKIQEAVLAATNDDISQIKKVGNDETAITIVDFDSYVKPPTLLRAPVSDLRKMSKESYQPSRGFTALYDGIGSTIDLVKKFDGINDKDTSVYFVIVSDGEENRSKHYSAAQVAKMIQDCTDTGRWKFIYIGANQNVAKTVDMLGISRGNAMSYTAGGKQYLKASSINRAALTNFVKKTGPVAKDHNLLVDVAKANEDGIVDADKQ